MRFGARHRFLRPCALNPVSGYNTEFEGIGWEHQSPQFQAWRAGHSAAEGQNPDAPLVSKYDWGSHSKIAGRHKCADDDAVLCEV